LYAHDGDMEAGVFWTQATEGERDIHRRLCPLLARTLEHETGGSLHDKTLFTLVGIGEGAYILLSFCEASWYYVRSATRFVVIEANMPKYPVDAIARISFVGKGNLWYRPTSQTMSRSSCLSKFLEGFRNPNSLESVASRWDRSGTFWVVSIPGVSAEVHKYIQDSSNSGSQFRS